MAVCPKTLLAWAPPKGLENAGTLLPKVLEPNPKADLFPNAGAPPNEAEDPNEGDPPNTPGLCDCCCCDCCCPTPKPVAATLLPAEVVLLVPVVPPAVDPKPNEVLNFGLLKGTLLKPEFGDWLPNRVAAF